MSSRVIAAGLALVGLIVWCAPGFNGFLFEPSDVTAGEGRIAGAVFLVGSAVLWFRRS